MEYWPEFLAKDGIREFLAGGLAGMAGVVAGHPLDTLKVRLQQPDMGSGKVGALALLRDTVTTEGPRALYKGMASPLLSVAFQNALLFNTYATLARAMGASSTSADVTEKREPLSYWHVFVAGSGAGLVQTAIMCPVDRIKIQLQTKQGVAKLAVAGGRSLKTGMMRQAPAAMALHIAQSEGIRGFYRGLSATLLRDVPGTGAYFWSYEFGRELLHPGCRKGGDEGLSTMLVAGGVAGAFSWFVVYPTDVIKSRLQAQPVGMLQPVYRGTWDCLQKSMKKEGASVLWRGLGTTLLRAFVVNAATFAAYEMTLRLLQSVPSQEYGF